MFEITIEGAVLVRAHCRAASVRFEMSNGKFWFDKQLGKVRADHPLVTQRVVTRLRRFLGGRLGERQLTTADLEKLAKALIEEISASEAPEPEEDCED